MKALLLTAFALACTAAHADVYRCPQAYPDKDKLATPLTSATMTQDTDLLLAGGFMTDDEAAEEGYDEHYTFDPEWQTRLVCLYGGTKRISGRFHDGHEWNQRIEGGTEWSVKLIPKTNRCTLQVRERKGRGPSRSTWTVTATCQRQ